MVELKIDKEQFKNTEVGIIPKDWNVINFGETSQIKARIGWQGLTTKEYKISGDYYLITGTDFINNRVKWESCFYVDEYRYIQDSNIQIKDGDVLITKDGTIGKVAYVENITKPATLNSGVFVVRPINESYNPKFLFYILNSFYFDKFLKQLTAGSTISHLYQKDIVKFKFPCPSKEEQDAISIVLSNIDDLILSIEKSINKKKLIKQGLMKDLLEGKKRLSGFDGLWETKKIEDICKVYRGASPRPINDKKWFERNSSVGWIRISDLSNAKKYLKSTVQKLSEAGISKSRFVKCNSVIMSICATVGKPIITNIDACIHDGFVVFEELKLDKEFFYYVLQQKEDKWARYGQTGSQMNLNTGIINNEVVLFPTSLDEQQAIALAFSDIDEEINKLGIKLEKYKNIKNGMMEELLTGKRRLI